MRRTLIVVPELLPFVGGKGPGELWQVTRLHPVQLRQELVGEAIGLNPERYPLAAGPLMVAALGADPPANALRFQLSLMGLNDAGEVVAAEPPTPEEARVMSQELPRLSAKEMTVLTGPALEHALVLERASLDLQTTDADDAIGRPLREIIPVGENESRLRRLMDDSVNLLREQEFNQRRRDEGRAPLELLLPWGQAYGLDLPYLPLKLGGPAEFGLAWAAASRWSVAGLAKLCGLTYRDRGFAFRADFSPGKLPLAWHFDEAVLAAVDGRREERAEQHWQETLWPWIQRLMEHPDPQAIGLFAPSRGGIGLAATWDSRDPQSNRVPFDERVRDDRAVPLHRLWEFVQQFLARSSPLPPSPPPN